MAIYPVNKREEVAALAHSQWAGWMGYMFSKFVQTLDGEWVLPMEFVERWTRQMNTEYADLSEPEKDSDRKEADKFLAVFMDYICTCGRHGAVRVAGARLVPLEEAAPPGGCVCDPVKGTTCAYHALVILKERDASGEAGRGGA